MGDSLTPVPSVNLLERINSVNITSSLYYPQGNGEAERGVKPVKELLKKGDEPYRALLAYRSTPLAKCCSKHFQLRYRPCLHVHRYIIVMTLVHTGRNFRSYGLCCGTKSIFCYVFKFQAYFEMSFSFMHDNK